MKIGPILLLSRSITYIYQYCIYLATLLTLKMTTPPTLLLCFGLHPIILCCVIITDEQVPPGQLPLPSETQKRQKDGNKQ